MHDKGEKIAVLTCYDASFATLLEDAGVEALLVGDSLGMTLQGEETTLPVTLDDMVYHTPCVAKGAHARASSPTCPSAATRKARSRRYAAPRA